MPQMMEDTIISATQVLLGESSQLKEVLLHEVKELLLFSLPEALIGWEDEVSANV